MYLSVSYDVQNKRRLFTETTLSSYFPNGKAMLLPRRNVWNISVIQMNLYYLSMRHSHVHLNSILIRKTRIRTNNVLSDIGEERTEKYYHMNDWKTVVLIYLPLFQTVKVLPNSFISCEIGLRETFNWNGMENPVHLWKIRF